jgi:peroxiredoxin/outer membrane lipoprotein-sorting protein
MQLAGCEKPAATSHADSGTSAAGPKPSSSADAAQGESGNLTSAHAVLDKMAEAYHNATSYEDGATAEFWPEGAKEPERANFQLAFQRPNKLRMQFYQGELTCDGKKWCGFSRTIPDQAVLRDAPEKITMPMVTSDVALNHALNNGFAGGSPQLLLLLADRPLKDLLEGVRDQDVTLEEPVRVGDYDCYRVRFRRMEGDGEYWIDKKTFVLRHMQFRAAPPPGSEASGPAEGVHIEANFERAQLNAPVDPAAFKLEVPQGVECHRALLELGPYQVVGKKLADFQLVDARGNPWKSESLAGKIAVLHLWQSDVPACPGVVPSLQAAYEKFKDNPRVVFWAINLDPPEVETKTVEDTARQWKLALPILRDLKFESHKSLKTAAAPATFFIDAQGVMQDCILGDLPVSTAGTTRKIEDLLAGKELAKQAVAEFHEQFTNYEAGVDKVFSADAGTMTARRVEDTPAAKSTPAKLRLQPLWTCKWDPERRPGNLLVVQDAGGKPRIFAVDGFKAISEISLNGKAVGAFAPKLADGEFFTCLRSAAGRDGKRFFLAFAAGQQRFHLFDEKLNYLLSYPPDALENRHTGISDVALGDLDGDGVLKAYMGFAGMVGAKCISLKGVLLWSCRNLIDVGKVVPGPADAHGQADLYCVNDANNIAILDAKGQPRGSARLPADGLLRGLVHANVTGGSAETWCGIVFLPDPQQTSGQFTALGLDESGNVQWKYQLPAGTQQTVEPIVAGRVLPGKAAQWLLPGSDGSIHILAADGTLIDRFNYGAQINGLAAVEIDGKPVLLISSANGVEALSVER